MPKDDVSSVPPAERKPSSPLSPAGAVIREFFIDFFGGLVPGFFFASLATPLLLCLGFLCWKAILATTHLSVSVDKPLEIVNALRVVLFSVFLVLAYVIGSVFHRRDPKTPDQESAVSVFERMTDPEEVPRSVIQPPPDQWPGPPREKSWPAGKKVFTRAEARKWASGEGAQFPYSHLKEYLQARGLYHLARLVNWGWSPEGEKDKSASEDASKLRAKKNLRSKMFINVLKVRLHYSVPEKCGEIIRNEAHVRMMSSLWYACKALQKLAIYGFAIAFAPSAVLWRSDGVRIPGFWLLTVTAAFLFGSSKWLQLRIREFIHYQRVREIVFVLETAWYASQQKGHEDILKNLPGDEFEAVYENETKSRAAAGDAGS